jgi:DNA mismatch repair protein MutS
MVFLHEVVEGAASESYGVEVARMAGVPDEVVERADELVEDGFGDGTTESSAREDGPKQAKLDGTVDAVGGDETRRTNGEKRKTEGTSDTSDIVEQIAEIDTANTTPIEALNILNRLSKKAEETDGK